jgi:DNA-binding LytR/AlgR family response regulator
MLKTLIVDDEPIARSVLRDELSMMADVEVVGEAEKRSFGADRNCCAASGPSAAGFANAPDGRSGCGSPDQGRSVAAAVVIVTAWNEHAIQAFEAGAIDYLLKPVSHERLAEAVERARRFSARDAAERIARLQEIAPTGGSTKESRARRIVGRVGSEYVLLSADEVYAFQADGDIVWIITAKNKYLATQPLKTLEGRLAQTTFRRIHRNALVNVDHIRKMSTLTSQRWLVTLNNKMEFIVSKRQARGIRDLLSL